MTDIDELRSFSCPGWETLPEIDLYMDQVLTLVSKYFGIFNGAESVTASMINNYVKASVVPAPNKKRYGKEHISRIFIICVLKRVLSISQIGTLLHLLSETMDSEQIYGLFREKLDLSVRNISSVRSRGSGCCSAVSVADGAELALQCAVDAFSNCVLADIMLNEKQKEPQPAGKE